MIMTSPAEPPRVRRLPEAQARPYYFEQTNDSRMNCSLPPNLEQDSASPRNAMHVILQGVDSIRHAIMRLGIGKPLRRRVPDELARLNLRPILLCELPRSNR